MVRLRLFRSRKVEFDESATPRLAASRRPAGFTLVELLVVVAIIGVLVALLLPAIQSARSGPPQQLRNNLKQLGLALQNYHDACKAFPYSNTVVGTAMTSVSTNQGINWVVAVLPYCEGSNLMSQYNRGAYFVDAAANASFRGAKLSFMLCPSDVFTRAPFNAALANIMSSSAQVGVWGRGCYASNSIVNWLNNYVQTAGSFGPAGVPWNTLNYRGVMLQNVSCSMHEILDGTSKTVLLAEIRADVGPAANRGLWAGTEGTSSLYGHGGGGGRDDEVGPNSGSDMADDSPTCNQATTAAGGASQLQNLGMGCSQQPENWETGPKSLHPGGVQSVFCDGSVHWIDDNINCGTGSTNGYYEYLFLSCDNQAIPGDVYNQ